MPISGTKKKHQSLGTDWSRQSPTPRNLQGGGSPPAQCSLSQLCKTAPSTRLSNDNYWRVLGKWSHQRNDSTGGQQDKLLDPNFSKRKERQCKSQAHYRSETTEQLPPDPTPQTSNVENSPTHIARQDLAMGPDVGPQEFFPPPAASQEDAEMDEVQDQRQRVPNFGNALWLGHEPMVGQQAHQTNTELAQQQEDQALLVGGRHLASGKNKARSREQCHPPGHIIDLTGSEGQSRKEHDQGRADLHVPGTLLQPADQPDQAPGEESRTDPAHVPTPADREPMPTQECCQTCGDTCGCQQEQHQAARTSPTNDEICSLGSETEPDIATTLEQTQVLESGNKEAQWPAGSARGSDTSSGRTTSQSAEANITCTAGFENRCKPTGLGRPPEQGIQGDPDMRPDLGGKRQKTSHHTPRSFGQCQSCGSPHQADPTRLSSEHTIRCCEHCMGLEERKQNTRIEQAHPAATDPTGNEGGLRDSRPHTWNIEQKSGLVEQEPGPQELQAQPHGVPTGMPTFQLLPPGGPVCLQEQQTGQEVLLLESRPTQPGQCLSPGLAQTEGVDEPTMGHHPPVPAEGETRQSPGIGLPTNVAECTLVEYTARATSETTSGAESPETVPRSRRTTAPTTTLGNPFWGATRLKPQEVRTRLRTLENEQDIPAKTRAKWVQEAQLHVTNPKVRTMMTQTIKRLTAAGKKPKYPIFYRVDALLKRAFHQDSAPQTWTTGKLLDQLLLQLRLTTLMRSGDAANIAWALFEQDSKYYIKTTDKNGALQTYSVTGVTLSTLLHYLDKYKDHPGLYLFRYTNEPHSYLGAERLAKRLLNVMSEEGIDTNTFKAHSLRGATATHLLQQGAPQSLVQARGKWASSDTLDKYYSRLHQQEDWEGLLGGNAKGRQATACAVPSPPVPQAEPTEEGGSWGTQGGAQHKVLHCAPEESSDRCMAHKNARPVAKKWPARRPTGAVNARAFTTCAAWAPPTGLRSGPSSIKQNATFVAWPAP